MDKHQIDDGVSIYHFLNKNICRSIHDHQKLCEELFELEIAEDLSLGLRLRRKHYLEVCSKHHSSEINDEPSIVAV